MLRSLGLTLVLCVSAFGQSADIAAPGLLRNSKTSIVQSSSVTQPSQGGSYSALLLSNGGFVTGIGNGAGGADTSEIQVGYNTYGYGHQLNANRVADDFAVPAGKTWSLTDMKWYAYQTGAPTTGTINNVNVRIWSGVPSAGGTVLAGDTTTNRFVSQSFTNCYRVTATTLTDISRAIIEVTVDMSWAPVLPAGTYYVDVQCGGTLASGPWAPPTAPFLATDNGEQQVGVAGLFAVIVPIADFPFKLNGTELTGTTTYCTAKTTSIGCIPAIGSTGAASATAGSGFVVNASQMINNKSCLLFYGSTGQAAVPFQGGTLCVKTPIKRTTGTTTGGNPPPNDCSGAPSIDMNTFALTQVPGSILVTPGTTIDCQWWGRDPGFIAPNNTQLSDALEYVVGP